MKKVFFLIFMLTVINSFGQKTLERRMMMMMESENFYSDYLLTPYNNADSLDINIVFKVSNSVLAFNQTRLNRKDRGFIATPVIEAVFYDADGIIRNRKIWNDSIYVSDFEKTNDKFTYTYGVLSTKIKKQKYKIKISLYDKYNKEIAIRKFDVNANINKEFSQPFFTEKKNEDEIPVIFNGNIKFSSHSNIMYFLSDFSGESIPIRINKIEKFNNENELWKDKISFANYAILSNNSLEINLSDDENPTIDKKNYTQKNIYSLELPSYEFVPGKYKLIFGEAPDTSYYFFDVKWENEPVSLKDMDYALKAMNYILTDEELNKIDDGDEADVFKNLIDYWKSKDPTPNSPYNEAMAEYFKRVDHAAKAFKTLGEPDGTFTDRGKIYILYGPPSEDNSTFIDEKNYIIWTYTNRVKKVFKFEMIEVGVYRLVDIIDLNKTGES